VGGKVNLYRKLLHMFVKSQADCPARIRNALQSQDLSTAEREVHSLKGVAGNLGAAAVAAAAKRLETAMQQDADTENPIAELEKILGELVAGVLAQVPDSDGATETAEVDVADGRSLDLSPALDRLQVLLQDYDGEAGDLVAELQSQTVHTALARPMRAIAGCVDNFEFDEALELLSALRAIISTRSSDPVTPG